MKNLIIFLILLCSCSTSQVSQPETILREVRTDNRLTRFCYTKNDGQLMCYRQMHLCNEAQFEETYVGNNTNFKPCSRLKVERELLPYWDQY